MTLQILYRAALAALLSAITTSAFAADTVVFYLDEHYSPVVRLDRLPNPSEATKALLALYALENGAGCEGFDENRLVRCSLTKKLGLGSNCSPEHISLVRSWFTRTPNLTSRWSEKLNADTKKATSLEDLCYGQTYSASWQNIWEIIRVGATGDIITVNAIQVWGSQNGHGRVRYKSTYRIERHTITELSSDVTELERSSESAF